MTKATNIEIDPAQWPERTRPNSRAKAPYAYFPDPEDPLRLLPDATIVVWVEKAMDYLDAGNSLRETAAWLSDKSGYPISHQGMSNIWKRCRAKDKKNERAKKLRDVRRKNAPKTKEEKDALTLRRKRSAARRNVTVYQKKIDEMSGTSGTAAPTNGLTGTVSLDYDAVPQDVEIIFTPNPGPQTQFLAAMEREVMYGGSAGGGKSYGLLADPLRYFDHKDFNGLILRRTNDELRELIWKSQELYPKAFPGSKWSEKKSQWTFPSGARLWLTYLERDEDVLRYQGQAFSYIGIDELTQYATPFAWNYMRSRLRTTAEDLPLFMRATTNPGGAGHAWVKKMFIDPAPPNIPFAATDIDTGKPLVFPEGHNKAGQALFSRKFIPASLYDNPHLMKDSNYEASLLSLPEMQRRQLLEGDWTIAEGAAFPEFRHSIHVIDPFEIPDDWRRFRSCDYGYSSYSAVYWFAIDPAFETLIVYRELYTTKRTGRELARDILQLEVGESLQYGILDSSCWHTRGQTGPSIAEEMIAEGCRWRPSDRSGGARVSGKNRLHELLRTNPECERPGIMFFNTCRQVLADMSVIPCDPKGSEDIDPRFQSDHSYDSIRYGIMSRPRAKSPFDFGPGGMRQSNWRPSDSVFGY